jgi:hypothetical protein
MEDIGESEMTPDVVSYTTVMDGWAKSNQNDSVPRIEQIFGRMKAVHNAGNKSTRPNSWTYVTLIHTYAKQRDAAANQKAEDLIFQMYKKYKKGRMDLKPNTQLVTAVMDA